MLFFCLHPGRKRPWNLPYKILDKIRRTLNPKVLVQRNWELQFIGTANEKALEYWLFENPEFLMFVAPEVVSEFYGKFANSNQVATFVSSIAVNTSKEKSLHSSAGRATDL